MKKLLLLAIVLSTTCVGCVSGDVSEVVQSRYTHEDLNKILDDINISSNVDCDFELLTTFDELEIVWSSNNEALVIDGSYAILDTKNNQTVKLTASITYANLTVSKSFNLYINQVGNYFNVWFYDNELITTTQILEYNKVENYEIEKEGYKFLYWSNNGEEYNFESLVSNDLKLEAVWEVNKYEVTYKSESEVFINTVNYNEKLDYLFLEKENMNLIGWYYNDELFDFNTPITNDIQLEAKWEECNTYYVTFIFNGLVKTYAYNENSLLSIPEEFNNDITWRLSNLEEYDYNSLITNNLILHGTL